MVMTKYITLSSLIFVSVSYGSERDLDVLSDTVKALVIRVREEYKPKIDQTLTLIKEAKNLSEGGGNTALLNLVHLGCSEIQEALNKDYLVAQKSASFWRWSRKPYLEYTDEQGEVIINYMYGLLDEHIPLDNQARKKSIEKSLTSLKSRCYGYRVKDPAMLAIDKAIYVDQMVRNAFLAITVGVLGFSLYQRYKESKANMQRNEQ